MIKKTAMFLLMAALVISPVFGATENSVNKNLAVKDDFAFQSGGTFVSLYIEEQHINEFANADVGFRLKINNAEWFEAGDPSDPAAMEAAATKITNGTITIQRVGDQQLEITLNRAAANASEKAWWRIPIYATVTAPGIVSLEVDGRDDLVSSGTYQIAESHGGDYLNKGYNFTPENPQWITFREPQPNAYAGTQKFRLVLENGTWFPESDTRLGAQAMLKAAVVSGIEAGSLKDINRVDDKTLELTLLREAGSSVKAKGVWSLPVYFTVDKFGLAKVKVEGLGGAVNEGTLGSQKVAEPIRYIRTVTLVLNKPQILTKQGSEQKTLTLDVAPVNPAGSTLIPVRGVLEQLGATVLWNGDARLATFQFDGKEIVLSPDSAEAKVNGSPVTLIQKPVIINGRLLIPLRSVSEQLGFGVEWIQETQQIIIRQD